MERAPAFPDDPTDGSGPAMGSEYSNARQYIARVDAQRARESDAASHGANESDFGADRLNTD